MIKCVGALFAVNQCPVGRHINHLLTWKLGMRKTPWGRIATLFVQNLFTLVVSFGSRVPGAKLGKIEHLIKLITSNEMPWIR